jgi:hypothetical protein
MEVKSLYYTVKDGEMDLRIDEDGEGAGSGEASSLSLFLILAREKSNLLVCGDLKYM